MVMVTLLAVYVLRVPSALCVPLAVRISFALCSLHALGLLSWLSLMQLLCLGEVVLHAGQPCPCHHADAGWHCRQQPGSYLDP